MICAHTVRKVKPGQAEAFISEFTPPGDGGGAPPAGWVRFFALKGQNDPDTVVTFGFFDGTREEMDSSQIEHGYAERRRNAEEQYVDSVISNDVYDVVVHMKVGETTPA
jgi:hypothetical protein